MKPAPPLIILSLLLAGCGRGEAPSPLAAAADATASVEVTPVKSAILATTVSLPGQLLAFESVDLYPKVSGFIDQIAVDRGSHVRKGQVLVRLSAPEIGAQEAQAAATLRAVEAKLASDRATYQRLTEAAKTPGAVAENDVDVARQLAASDVAQVQSSTQAVRAAREVGGYLTIRAPFDGVITARNLHPGAIVGPSTGAGAQPILQLASDGRLRLAVAVPEADIQAVRPGQLVSFTAPTAPGKAFSATVARMSGAIDPRMRTMMIEADITDRSGVLTPGSFVTVQWPVRRPYATLRVPPTAVANDQQRQFVVKVSNGAAEWVDVTTGMSADGGVEVFGKLAPGDLVLKRGGDAVHDGAKVKPTLSK